MQYTCERQIRGDMYGISLLAAHLLERDLRLSVDIGERYESFPTILRLVRKNPTTIPSSHHSACFQRWGRLGLVFIRMRTRLSLRFTVMYGKVYGMLGSKEERGKRMLTSA